MKILFINAFFIFFCVTNLLLIVFVVLKYPNLTFLVTKDQLVKEIDSLKALKNELEIELNSISYEITETVLQSEDSKFLFILLSSNLFSSQDIKKYFQKFFEKEVSFEPKDTSFSNYDHLVFENRLDDILSILSDFFY